jgi:hypothetical protein
MLWHHAKTASGQQASSGLNGARGGVKQREKARHASEEGAGGNERPRDCAEAFENPPLPWNSALRRPLQLSVTERRE